MNDRGHIKPVGVLPNAIAYGESFKMGGFRERAKNTLRAVSLYEPVRGIWERRPSFRLLCWNAGYRLAGSDDGLPIPPTRLIYLVAHSKEVSWYLRSGHIGIQSIHHVLQLNGLQMEGFERILDFGCGCGRILRRWQALQRPRLYGTDYNPDLVRWCRSNLPDLAEFSTNDLRPPLDYEDEMFDFIYAISVFTHLTETLQKRWIGELKRVLKPKGVLLLTTHGESRLYELDAQQQRRFRAGQLVVQGVGEAGANVCNAYHPEHYVREHLVNPLDVVDFVPRGARDTDQDVWLLEKPTI